MKHFDYVSAEGYYLDKDARDIVDAYYRQHPTRANELCANKRIGDNDLVERIIREET